MRGSSLRALGRWWHVAARRRALTALAAPSATGDDGAPWSTWLDSTVAELDAQKLLRALDPVSPVDGNNARVLRGGRTLTVAASNDYLGLSAHPRVRAAAAAAASAHGSGPRSSAHVCGHTEAHRRLELALAALKATEAAVLFPTGFAANLAVLSALASPSTAIFSDALNHASIVDGARLAARSGATVHVYRHADLDHLESLLRTSASARKLIVSDSLFSMDGDVADCAGLATLRDRYGALLVLDEAHATLVYGERGGGVAEAHGVEHKVDVHVGTLSKAFGAFGGFVGCTRQMRGLLLSRGRAGIYSTALPAPAVAAAAAAIDEATPELRAALWDTVRAFGAAARLGPGLPSPIVPIVVGSETAALDAAGRMLRAGYLVPAIRPPTVPRGSARLRVALSAALEPCDVEGLARALDEEGVLDAAARARAAHQSYS